MSPSHGCCPLTRPHCFEERDLHPHKEWEQLISSTYRDNLVKTYWFRATVERGVFERVAPDGRPAQTTALPLYPERCFLEGERAAPRVESPMTRTSLELARHPRSANLLGWNVMIYPETGTVSLPHAPNLLRTDRGRPKQELGQLREALVLVAPGMLEPRSSARGLCAPSWGRILPSIRDWWKAMDARSEASASWEEEDIVQKLLADCDSGETPWFGTFEGEDAEDEPEPVAFWHRVARAGIEDGLHAHKWCILPCETTLFLPADGDRCAG